MRRVPALLAGLIGASFLQLAPKLGWSAEVCKPDLFAALHRGTQITDELFVAQQARALAEVRDPKAGLYGPDSMMWMIFRERSIKLAAVPYVLIQLGNPRVAHAVGAYSRVQASPVERLTSTFDFMGRMIFGDQRTAVNAANAIQKIHQRVGGELPTAFGAFRRGASLSPNDAELLYWSQGVLWDLAVRTFEATVRPLSPVEKEKFFAETLRFARLMGVPDQVMARSFEEFQRMMAESYSKLTVSPPGKQIVDSLFASGEVPMYVREYSSLLPPKVAMRTAIAYVGRWVPDQLVEAYGLRSSPLVRGAVDSLSPLVGAVYRRLPDEHRIAHAYRNAMARLESGDTATAPAEKLACPFAGFFKRER